MIEKTWETYEGVPVVAGVRRYTARHLGAGTPEHRIVILDPWDKPTVAVESEEIAQLVVTVLTDAFIAGFAAGSLSAEYGSSVIP